MADEQKTIQEKLLISETRYRKLFETAKDGILIIDPLTDRIIDANPYLLEMIGYSLEETIGKKLPEIGAFRDIEATRTMVEEIHTKGSVRYEDLPLKTKDGREIEVEFVSNIYPITKGIDMIQCNIRNITDRRAIEKKAKDYLEGLEKLNSFMTNREIKMVELKEEIKRLKTELSSIMADVNGILK